MRRLASEIIRDLEIRIANLEKQSAHISKKEQDALNKFTDSIRKFHLESTSCSSLFKSDKEFFKKLVKMNDLISEVSRELPNKVRNVGKHDKKASKVNFNDKYLMRAFNSSVGHALRNQSVESSYLPFEMSRGGKIILETPLKGNKAVKVTLDAWTDEAIENMSVGKPYSISNYSDFDKK